MLGVVELGARFVTGRNPWGKVSFLAAIVSHVICRQFEMSAYYSIMALCVDVQMTLNATVL